MRTIYFYRAQGIGKEEVEPVIFKFEPVIPEPVDLKEARRVFTKEGEELFQALLNSLPGGTLSALFARMCEHYRNLFIVKG